MTHSESLSALSSAWVDDPQMAALQEISLDVVPILVEQPLNMVLEHLPLLPVLSTFKLMGRMLMST